MKFHRSKNRKVLIDIQLESFLTLRAKAVLSRRGVRHAYVQVRGVVWRWDLVGEGRYVGVKRTELEVGLRPKK